MSRLVTFALIAAGVGLVAYVMPTSESGREQRLAAVVSIATNATRLPRADEPASRFAAPKLVAPAPQAVSSGRVQLVPSPARTADPAAPAPRPVIHRAAPSSVGDPDQRADLVRDIQHELRRVGCFEGEPDGRWNAAAQRAMSAFNDRVNATLPVDEPDQILLTLVQGRASRVCNAACPAGQSMSTAGRCLPTAVAMAAPRAAGRMALAGPQVTTVTPVLAPKRKPRTNVRRVQPPAQRYAVRSIRPSSSQYVVRSAPARQTGNSNQFATRLFAQLTRDGR